MFSILKKSVVKCNHNHSQKLHTTLNGPLISITTGQREGHKGAHFAAPDLGAVNTLNKALILFEMFTPI